VAFPQRVASRIKRKAPEAAFHITVARYLSFALPPQFFWTTFPAGGGGFIRGATLKRMGLKPGLPDLVIFSPHGVTGWDKKTAKGWWCYHNPALWLELKVQTGRVSADQRQVHKALETLGHRVEVVKSLDQVKEAVGDFIFPNLLRARLT